MNHVIIDGYNVIHAVPSLKRSLAQHPETARELLIHSVSKVTFSHKFRATIVFDGSSPDSSHPEMRAPVHVVFSFPLSADEKIKQMIEVNKPVLFDCVVDPYENCYPMIPSGAAHDQMILSDAEDEPKVTEAGKILV